MTALGAAVAGATVVVAGLASAGSAQAATISGTSEAAVTAAPLAIGPRLSGAVTPQIAAVRGERMISSKPTGLMVSKNWSGMGGTGTAIEGAAGSWTVPAVRASKRALYSASWVGVDGLSNTSLIQTGTAQDTSDGYYAWWEILPYGAEQITSPQGALASVEPGDHITASVSEQSKGVWTIYIDDTTEGWYFDCSFDYSGPGHSAEWVEEAPTVNGAQASPADFGTVDFSSTSVYGKFGRGTGWYSTDLTTKNEIAMADRTHVLAMPTAPSAASGSGQSFADRYVTAPSSPRHVAVVRLGRSAGVTWTAPANTGGSPVARYFVREYVNGVWQRTVVTTDAGVRFTGLRSDRHYRFSIAAESVGAYTSRYTHRTEAIEG
jgi:hypothetical protein